MKRTISIFLVFTGIFGTSATAEEPKQAPAEEVAIRKTVESYVQAYRNHDAKSLAEHWSPEAVYINRATGERVVGRAAIAEQFASLFKAQPELTLAVSIESIQLLSPGVGVENGTATLGAPGKPSEDVKYSAVYVKRNGQWLLDRVTDSPESDTPSHYDQLKPLEWMVGTWVDDDKKAHIETECQWTKNRNFLRRSFSISIEDRIEITGMQIIGWDASAKTIRSWTFDSDGGVVEATWVRNKDRWIIRNKGVLANGQKASAVNIIKQVDANSFTWQTIERTVGSELLPNIDEVLIVRQ